MDPMNVLDVVIWNIYRVHTSVYAGKRGGVWNIILLYCNIPQNCGITTQN